MSGKETRFLKPEDIKLKICDKRKEKISKK